jgi:hypothetical protein
MGERNRRSMMELFLVIVPSGGGGKLGIVYGCTGGVGYIMDKWGTGLTFPCRRERKIERLENK